MEYDGTHYLYRKNFFGDVTEIYNSSGTCVTKYVYDAHGACNLLNANGTENTNAEFIGNINPILYRGYYYDVETGFYYCGSRYFVPQLGMWLNHEDMLDKQDAIHTTSSVPTVKAMAVISTATKNEEKPSTTQSTIMWSEIGGWFTKNFGGYIDNSYRISAIGQGGLFIGYEQGTTVRNIIGDDSKPISFFVTPASHFLNFWEYQAGVKNKLGEFEYSYSMRLGEKNIALSYNGTTISLKSGINKIGVTISQELEDGTYYNEVYVRTIPTALVLLAILVPGALPFAIGATLAA